MNIFKENYQKYIDKGYSVIPDNYKSKKAAIKAWSDYSYKIPTSEELSSWSDYLEPKGSGISVMLGEASGIIALDVDTDDVEILELIENILPKSPVGKKGSKGYTYFFKYSNENTQILTFNGNCILEVLSNNKKTTLPPSIHPNGASYHWITEKTLLDVTADELPLFPTFLIPNLEQLLREKFPSATNSTGKLLLSGRNNVMSNYCGELIKEKLPVDIAINKLIEKDQKENDPPLFQDSNEFRHTEPFTNALQFYSNILNTANTKNFRAKNEYEIPTTGKLEEEVTGLGKLQGQVKKSSMTESSLAHIAPKTLPEPQGLLKKLKDNILNNAFIKQDEFAYSGALIALSTLIGRKLQFQGSTSNLYLLNVAPSGSGKNIPQEKIKEWYVNSRLDRYLGGGDYVSDASLMDNLSTNPSRIDILDEAGEILKTFNKGKAEYNGKMAAILAELYTSSTSKYLGRTTSEGRKGECYRPNVNILGSTTPTGFSEGVDRASLEKGLLGRFLIFKGSSDKPSQRVKNRSQLDAESLNTLSFWGNFKPTSENEEINGIAQNYEEIQADDKANSRLDEIFEEFDNLRRNVATTEPMLPVICRLYQQMVKLVMIHAVSRCGSTIPVVSVEDVEFGYQSILYIYENIRKIIGENIYDNNVDRLQKKVLKIIQDNNGLTKTQLNRLTTGLTKQQRDGILSSLIEADRVAVDVRGQAQYYFAKDVL